MPLLVCGLVTSVDVVCRVENSGPNGQSGAIRYALATALCSFVDVHTMEKMRIGLS